MTLEKLKNWQTEKMEEIQGDKVDYVCSPLLPKTTFINYDSDKQILIEKFECTLARAGHNEQKYTDCGQMLK